MRRGWRNGGHDDQGRDLSTRPYLDLELRNVYMLVMINARYVLNIASVTAAASDYFGSECREMSCDRLTQRSPCWHWIVLEDVLSLNTSAPGSADGGVLVACRATSSL